MTNQKRWIVAPKKSNDIIEQVLINRGIKKSDWQDFLQPDFEKLSDPFKLKGMKQAVARIAQSMKAGETVGIFGDYDADGIPAAALLNDALTHLHVKTAVYIPPRDRGYGLSNEGIDFLARQGAKLVIAVDLGITAKAEVKQAKVSGIDVVIVDHHTVQPGKLPDAAAVVNPKQSGDRAPFRDYAACGLAYKLVQALAEHTGKISKTQLKWWLDLPAISTVADMVPLVGENRIITKYGLIVLSKTRRVGLAKLYEKAKMNPAAFSTSSISFQIAPRLNSPSRMEQQGSAAFELLTTDDEERADQLAAELEQINRERQAVLDRVLHEAKEKIEKDKLHRHKIIVVAGRGWPAGVVGLVAGRLMDQYARPTIVLRQDEKISKGSARSIQAFNIMEAFDHVKHHLLKHGGHPRAAGLSLENEHLEMVYDKLVALAQSKLTKEDITPKIEIDGVLLPHEVNLQLYFRLKQLEPHGVGNSKPVFLIENLIVKESRQVGNNGKHLKLWLGQTQNGREYTIGGIGFDLGLRGNDLMAGDHLDLVGYLDQDEWNGTKRLQLKVLDIKKRA